MNRTYRRLQGTLPAGQTLTQAGVCQALCWTLWGCAAGPAVSPKAVY